jgi:hypothetical protein
MNLKPIKHPHIMKTQNITLGQGTANLVMALRSIEQAKNFYYLAMQEVRMKNDTTDPLTEAERAVFDTVSDLVEKGIGDNIRTWAFSTNPGNEI